MYWSGSSGPWLGGYQYPPTQQPNANWRWVTGETWSYTNWQTGQPNDSGGKVEDKLQFGFATLVSTWNDCQSINSTPSYRPIAYVIEWDRDPPRIATQPAALRLYTGKSAQFSVVAESSTDMFYRWRKDGINLTDGGNISGSLANTLTVTNLTLADTGDCDVVVTNIYGSVTSAVAHLEVVVETTADTAFDAFNAAYLIKTNGLTYYAKSLTNRAPDGTWTMCLDIQGAQDAYERTQSPQQQQLLNDLLKTFLIQTAPPWSWDGWNDDIGWFSLALVRGYQMTGNTNFLAAAEYGYNYAFGRGWDTNYNGGGIWEQNPEYMPGQAPDKDPLANDSLAQVACMLFQSTSNAVYLAQAQQIYAWVRTNVFNPNTGQVYSRIHTNGVVDTGSALYNQGTFVDLANLLCQITGQSLYYTDALHAVEYVRNNLTSGGIFNSSASWLNTWAAEFARGLGHFVKDNNLWSTYYPWMLANANAAWSSRRTDYNVSWSAWTQPTPTTNDMIANWAVNAVAMLQMTPPSEPGFVACTNKLSGTVLGTAGSWNNSGNTVAKAFDGNLGTYFDGPDVTGDWVGLDGQINYYPRGGYASRMLGGIFQGANNPTFSNPVILCAIATTPLDNNVFTFQPVTNRAAFRYVRYLGPANGSCNVAELQFFSVNPPPPPACITNQWNGNQLTLSWQSGGTLLEATNVSGPWSTNVSATSPFIVTPSQPQKYYRLKLQSVAVNPTTIMKTISTCARSPCRNSLRPHNPVKKRTTR
jgi:hypothetical protein